MKPIHHLDQKTAQKETVGFIKHTWDKHPVVKNLHGKWKEYIQWFEGNQYTWFNPATGKIEDVTPFVERKLKNVYNRILPIIRQQWGELRYPHQFYVEPNTSDKEDIKGAKVGSQIIEWTNYKRNFNKKVNRAKLWAIITGNVFWKEFWNKNLYGYGLNSKGKLTKIPGDLDFNFINPFNVRPDPMAKERCEWRWVIEGKRVPREELAEEFEIDPKNIEGDSDAVPTMDTGLFERENWEKTDEEKVIRMEYYQLPSKQYPQGRMVVSGGGWLFYDDENPNPEHQLPIFHLVGVLPFLDEQWGDSLVRAAQPSQRQYNRLCSEVDEHIENHKLKAMIPFGSMRGGDFKAYTRAGVDFVTYNPRVGQPHWQNPPEVSQTIMGWIDRQENEMEFITSTRKPSLAQLPKYASRASGVLFQGLKQQDEAVLLPTIEDWDEELSDAVSFRLQLAQKHYTIPRLVKIFGKKKGTITSAKLFKGADIKENTDARVRSGIDIFTNRMYKQEVVGMLVEKGMISDPNQALELLGVKGVEEYMEDQFIDQRYANRQLEIMIEKPENYLAANPEDNHEICYMIFNNYRKSEEFESQDEGIQQNITKRIEEHKNYLQQEQGGATEEGTTETAPEEAVPEEAPVPEETATPNPEQLIAALMGGQGG